MISLPGLKYAVRFVAAVSLVSGISVSAQTVSEDEFDRIVAGLDPDDTVYYAATGTPRAFDPAVSDDMESVSVMYNVYETLVRSSCNTCEPVQPLLAESWTVCKNFKHFTFRLKKGVFFHDGTPFNSEAVKFSFERQIRKSRNGIQNKASLVFDSVEKIETPDPYTLKISLKYPDPVFLRNLSRTFACSIVSPAAVKKYNDDLSFNPVGTGPYVFSAFDKAEKRVLLKAFDAYHGKKAKVPSVVYTPYPEIGSEVVAVLRGKADLTAGPYIANIDPEFNDKYDFDVESISGCSVSLLVFNVRTNSVMSDFVLRKAVASAINIPELTERIYGEYAEPANAFFLPSMKGYDPELYYSRYNPEFSAEIFKAKDINHIRIITYSDSFIYNTAGGFIQAEAVAEYLRALGIKVTIQVYPSREYRYRLITEDWDLCFTNSSTDTGATMNLLSPLYVRSPAENKGGWYCEHFMNLMLAAFLSTDEQDYINRLHEIDRHIAHDLPVLPLSYNKLLLFKSSRIKGNIMNSLGLIDFSAIEKTPFLKKEEQKEKKIKNDLIKINKDISAGDGEKTDKTKAGKDVSAMNGEKKAE